MGGTLTFATARVIAPGPLPGHRVLTALLCNDGDDPLTLDARDLVLRDADGGEVPATIAFNRSRSTSGSVSPKHALVGPGQRVAIVVAWRNRLGAGEAVRLEHPAGAIALDGPR